MATRTRTVETRDASPAAAVDDAHAAADDVSHGAAQHHGAACLNCGAALAGPFCHLCGQKEVHPHDFSLRHFFGHTVLHELTHLDSNKILRTFGALLFRPGLLTAEYLAGRKGRQINPVRVYLTVSAVYFLFAWGALLNAGGFRDIERQPGLIARAERAQVSPREMGDKILKKAERYSSVLRFAGVLVSGLFLMALYYRTGRYYVEHLVFALHFYSFDFLMRCFYALLIAAAGASHLAYANAAVRVLFYVSLFAYLYFALLRVYRQSKPMTLLKTVVLFALEIGLFLAMIAAAFLTAFRTAA